MKEKKDIGEFYLQQLEMNPPKTSKMLYFQFSSKYGETVGRKMLSDLYRKISEFENNPDYLNEFYEMKNETLDEALLFNAGYQADNYRQMCNWIIANHDVFGKTILDAGCECGIMSCFLGMAFPDSQITAVDKSKNAICAARELAKRLDVHNVTFIQSELKELPADKYDTVFAMRLLQENCKISHVMSTYDLLKAEAARFSENIDDFSQIITSYVAKNGYLVSAERCDVDPVFLGWIMKLNECGMAGVPECYKELVCKEMENEGRIQVYVANNSGMEDEDEVYRFWCACQIVHSELVEQAQYKGWYADMELQNNAEQLIDGFNLQDSEGNNLLTYSLWTHRHMPEIILLYQAMNDERILSIYNQKIKDEIVEQIETIRKEYVQEGTYSKKLQFENGKLFSI